MRSSHLQTPKKRLPRRKKRHTAALLPSGVLQQNKKGPWAHGYNVWWRKYFLSAEKLALSFLVTPTPLQLTSLPDAIICALLMKSLCSQHPWQATSSSSAWQPPWVLQMLACTSSIDFLCQEHDRHNPSKLRQRPRWSLPRSGSLSGQSSPSCRKKKD